MTHDRDRQPDIGGAATVILVTLILGLLVLAVGGFFFLAYSRSQSQMVMARDAAMAAREKAVQAERERKQLLAESDPAEPDSATVQQLTIAIDEDGDTSIDGKSMRPDELRNELHTMNAGASGQLSVVVQVDDQCPFEHLAVILSLCDEAGIENPRLTASGK